MPRKTAKKETVKEKERNSIKKVSKQADSSFKDFDEMDNAPAEKTSKGAKTVKVHKLTLIIAAIIILLGVLMYVGRGFIVAVVVNGQPISRIALVQESEKASGKQAMASLIRNALVEQEATKQNLTASDKEINDQIKKIEVNLSKQGQKLDQMLILEGLTKDDLRKIVRLDVLVTKLIGKDIKISDKDIKDYIEKNKDLLPKDEKESQLKQEVADTLKRQQVSQKAQDWFGALEKKANIVKFVDY